MTTAQTYGREIDGDEDQQKCGLPQRRFGRHRQPGAGYDVSNLQRPV